MAKDPGVKKKKKNRTIKIVVGPFKAKAKVNKQMRPFAKALGLL